MPELPEVERARRLIQDTCWGYKIASVDTTEDKIVFTGGTDHDEFLEGRTITGCERKGKTFWMTLSGTGRFPVMHFGMTGMIQLKGQEPTWYRRRPKESADIWPPRVNMHILSLEPQDGSVGNERRELAFIDARRLGRLRLVKDPVASYPPVSKLGFDPILNHPTLDKFQDLIQGKKGTVKGMIMDQAFSAGVGNWVADEVLYQARIHPSCPVSSLSEQNIKDLHYQLRAVPLAAVSVNADSKHFPRDWLFQWRWGKGKETRKRKGQSEKAVDGEDGEDVEPEDKKFLRLPDGLPATIKFIEVGGRTTALVDELQKMPKGIEIKPKISKGGKKSRKRIVNKSSDKSELSDSDEDKPVLKKARTSRQKAIEEIQERKAENAMLSEEQAPKENRLLRSLRAKKSPSKPATEPWLNKIGTKTGKKPTASMAGQSSELSEAP
ncbi:uncharacterized protein L203_102310 [Cryptococcus depauperatus CBS 7841]|uniref:Formamidopyrimidine-DNA glycosylase catalytic domain-containing protein n=1 Tax=Cryptococcus depauperatus CBS 7841 TaxID=1295531 RepID=A0AAJ8JRK2_9TREE